MDLRERPMSQGRRHPWETARARFFTRLLVRSVPARPVTVLDVGAGDGFVGAQLVHALPAESTVTCFDSNYTAEDLTRLADGAPRNLAFARVAPDREHDAIVLLDVLEHVDDDIDFLRDFLLPRLAPGGVLIVSVPAHQALYTQHDVALGHRRRYSAAGLREAIGHARLHVEESGSLFGSLLVPRMVAKAAERARGIDSQPSADLADQVTTGISQWRRGRLITGAIDAALELDARLSAMAARASLPSVGLSVWAVCRR